MIIYTNLSYNEKREEAQSVGIDEFLVKADTRLENVVREVKKELGIVRQ